MKPRQTSWVVKPDVPEPVYTDRAEFLEYFHHAALEGAHRRTMSTVLLGRRRMGKTEIFKRVVNRLFFEQDPRDPMAVVPVYFSFPDTRMDEKRFATKYLENFMRYYVGFYTRHPEWIFDEPAGGELLSLLEHARSQYPFTRTFDVMLRKYKSVITGDAVFPQETALNTPRRIADIDDSTIVMFLDELQNTRMPHFDFEIVGWLQEAVESTNCPHFVTGSAMSILAREILGRGSLFGRFDSETIEPMSGYWGTELVLNAARYYQAEVPELMGPVIADRCGGNPFYITAVIRQTAKRREPLENEEALNKILAVDISSGFIWGDLHEQVMRWITRLNDYNITKWILYLSALEPDDKIDITRIREELRAREGSDVPAETIRDVLVKLSRGDLIEYLEMGRWFRKTDDPILNEFLRVWGRTEVEGQPKNIVSQELVAEYETLKRRVSEYKGYMAEVFMSQVLLNGQHKTLKGAWFHSDEDIQMPWPFFFVHHRRRLRSGKGQEIDLVGAAGKEVWVCQSKWVTGDPVGSGVLRTLTEQARAVQAELKPTILRLWLFASTGLTEPARDYAQEHGILWSGLEDFNALLCHLGLRPLPDV
ncbi:MAG: hypothetical protein GY765_40710 [bacterium]|nr:hypothetical protein [bacterium]